MRLSPFARTCGLTGALVLAAALSAPALAHDPDAHGHGHHQPGVAPDGPDLRPVWKGDAAPPPTPYPQMAYPPMGQQGTYDDPRAREQWLNDCRRRLTVQDRGRGGAAIGGIAGGILGNRIAGRHNRTVGTIAGAAVGAVAGAAIDRAEDNGRVRDECQAYLDDYYAYATQHQRYQQAPGYGYAVPMMMVPVAAVPQPQQHCTRRVITTYEYVDAPARRHIPRRVRDKRVRVVPDKRVQTY